MSIILNTTFISAYCKSIPSLEKLHTCGFQFQGRNWLPSKSNGQGNLTISEVVVKEEILSFSILQ